MAQYLELKTTGGVHLVNPGDLVLVQLKDGSYLEIPAAKSVKYVNECKIAIKRKGINVSFSELEEILLQSKGGQASQYKRAKERLFELNENNFYETKLSRILKRAQGEINKDVFLDRLYEMMRDYAAKNNFETVTRAQLDQWYTGKEIAPRDWRNFDAILQAKNEFPALEEFEQFSLDKKSYTPDTKRSVDENLYQAYLFYVCTRRFLGRKAETKFKYDPENITKQNSKPGPRKIDLDEVKKAIYAVFYEDIDEDFCAVSLVDVKETEASSNAAKGIYVVRKNEKKPKVEMKPTEELVKEVAILENVLLNNVNSFMYDELKSGSLGVEKRIDAYKYISYLLEERIRHNQIEKIHLFLTDEEINKCKKAANVVYKDIFESQKANKQMKLKDDSFQRFKATYDTLVPAYPKVMENAVNLISNAEKLHKFLEICRLVKEKKIKNVSISLPSKKQENKIKERLSCYLAKFEKVKDQHLELCSKYKLKQILSQGIVDYIYFLKENETNPNTEFNSTKGGILMDDNNKPLYYTEDDFKEVLTKYNLDEFIENDPDIKLIRKLSKALNNIDPLQLVSKSPIIIPHSNS